MGILFGHRSKKRNAELKSHFWTSPKLYKPNQKKNFGPCHRSHILDIIQFKIVRHATICNQKMASNSISVLTFRHRGGNLFDKSLSRQINPFFEPFRKILALKVS